MLKIYCEKCGNDCDSIAYDVLIRVLHNPTPLSITDTGDPKITCDNSAIRMTLCQDCYRKMGMPNIYLSLEKNKLTFREDD